jgi:hypothetical protein
MTNGFYSRLDETWGSGQQPSTDWRSVPWIVIFTLAACEGVCLVVSQRQWEIDDLGSLLTDASLLFPNVLVDEHSSPTEVQDVIRPILDALWQAAGLPKFSWYQVECARAFSSRHEGLWADC